MEPKITSRFGIENSLKSEGRWDHIGRARVRPSSEAMDAESWEGKGGGRAERLRATIKGKCLRNGI